MTPDENDADHAWSQAEENEHELSEVLRDIALSQKLLTEDPEYAIWSEERTQEAIEQQDKEQE